MRHTHRGSRIQTQPMTGRLSGLCVSAHPRKSASYLDPLPGALGVTLTLDRVTKASPARAVASTNGHLLQASSGLQRQTPEISWVLPLFLSHHVMEEPIVINGHRSA